MVDLLHRGFQIFCIGGPQRPFHDYTFALVQVVLGVQQAVPHRAPALRESVTRAGLSLAHLLT